jgi:HAE1 family hydrophobic/amphiphilic exporter-1
LEQTIRTIGSAKDPESLARMRLALSDGRSVRLSDLGTVESSWAEPRQRARFDGKEVISFSVYRNVGTGEVKVAQDVRTRISAFAAAHPEVSIREVTSSTAWVLIEALRRHYNAVRPQHSEPASARSSACQSPMYISRI